ncbi:T9SS type A sorting domain-containing protein [Draconibacterium halophilum]|uniref:T9SS type A sorting domain-containing protein n=1 Tax=Draconibacterium halophilum TaxID=2706887 RepID=A0A6C0RHC9_9BACT|nr:T9SS type A sorting domain-containing protein [Draconibacterium halophilum]QIA08491.1 T9SS type A sorting domain-containing protein [Draconibacterium halophilum]
MKNIYLTGFTFLLSILISFSGFTSEIGTNEKVGQSSNSAIDQQIIYCSNEDTFLVVWTNNTAGVDQIYYNFIGDSDLDPTGTLLSSTSTGPYPYAEKPQVAYDASTSTAGVVYTESNSLGNDSIMLSFIQASSGTILGTHSVGTVDSWNMSATVSSDNAGNFLVAYFDTTSQNISAKFFDNTGTQQGATLTLGSVPSAYLLPYSIDIAYNSTEDKFLVVWTDGSDNLYSRTVETNGTLSLSLNYGLISSVANPALAYGASTNEFFIVYDNFNEAVNGFVTDSIGNKSGTSFTFGNVGEEAFPDVIYNSIAESFAITWQEYVGNAGIWLQEYISGNCAALGDSIKLDAISATSNTPVIAFDEQTENYWVSWSGSVLGVDEIYLQRYSSELSTTNAICKDITVYLNDQGEYILQPSEIDNGSNGLCNEPVLSTSMDTLTCANMPFVDVDLIASDIDGNSDTCSARVTVLDTIPPTALCTDLDVYLDDLGQATIAVAEIEAGSSDNCGITSLAIDTSSFTCDDIGVNIVTLTISDAHGNSTQCTSTVSVHDTIPPTVVCTALDVYLDDSGLASITAADVDAGSTDNCSIASLSIDNSGFTCSDVGTNTVTLTVTDVTGNTAKCTSTVTVKDTILPTALCSDLDVYLNNSGVATITAFDVNAGSTDDCGIASLSIDSSTFTCNYIGANSVILTVTDVNGNNAQCTSAVNIHDTISPTAICQDIEIYLLDASGVVTIDSSMIDNGSSDNCSVVSMTLDKTSFSCADQGTNTVTLTVSDASGNTSECMATVTVVDKKTQTPICIIGFTADLDATGNFTLYPSDLLASPVTDNCSAVTLSLSKTDFNCSDVGINIIQLHATDTSGNDDYCETYIIINDATPPIAVCKDIDIYLDETGLASIDSSHVDNGSSDNCPINSQWLSQYDFTCANLGDNDVVLYASDLAGNLDSCLTTVSVKDTITPQVVCKNISVDLNQNGNATITASQLDGGSTDNCSIDSIYLDRYNFNTADIGTKPVTLYVKDASGNVSSCVAMVNIGDNIAPNVKCNPITIYMDENGEYPLSDEDVSALSSGTTDNITATEDLNIYAIAGPNVFNCNSNGHQVVVQVFAIDEAGNRGSCNRLINVIDTFPLTVNPIEDIDVMVGATSCDTTVTISYPELTTNNKCAEFTQISGLGPNGDYPLGTTEEKWLLTNTQGDSLEFSFFVMVTADNLPPTLDPIADVDTTRSVSELIIPLSGISSGGDCYNSDITITATGVNTQVVNSIYVNYASPDSGGELMLTLSSGASGSDTITVTVEESEGGIVTQTFVVTIDYSNQTPIIVTLLEDQEVIADQILEMYLGDNFNDLDSDTLKFDISIEDGSTLPDWISLVNDTLFAIPGIVDTGCVSIIVTATDPLMATASDTFTVCVKGITVGVGDISTSELGLTMYPNPSKGKVTVDFDAAVSEDIELVVSNISGKQVFQKTFLAGQQINFDLSDQVSGMYLVNVLVDDRMYTRKLILNKN